MYIHNPITNETKEVSPLSYAAHTVAGLSVWGIMGAGLYYVGTKLYSAVSA